MAERTLASGVIELTDFDRDTYLLSQGTAREAIRALRKSEIRAEVAERLKQREFSDYKDIHLIARLPYFLGDILADLSEYSFPQTELDHRESLSKMGRDSDDD